MMIYNCNNLFLKNLAIKTHKNILIMKFSHLAIRTSVMADKSHFHIVKIFKLYSNKTSLAILNHQKMMKISMTLIKICRIIFNKILNALTNS